MATQLLCTLLLSIKTKKYAKEMVKQSSDNPFPLKGIEHIYSQHPMLNFCKHCGYGADNLMHTL